MTQRKSEVGCYNSNRTKRARRLDFEPISTEAYLAGLKDLRADRKALNDRYRRSRAYEFPEALNAAENALSAVFGKTLDLARSLSATQIIPFALDEQSAVDQLVATHWNGLAERHGVPLRLEAAGMSEAGKGGLRFVELEPGAGLRAIEMLMPGISPHKWMSDVFIFLSLCMASEAVDPAIFAVQARRHWDWRLRQRVEGKNFADLARLVVARERAGAGWKV